MTPEERKAVSDAVMALAIAATHNHDHPEASVLSTVALMIDEGRTQEVVDALQPLIAKIKAECESRGIGLDPLRN